MKNSEDLQELSHRLSERVKELTCLYKIAKLVHRNDMDLSEQLHAMMKIIPTGWQIPKALNVYISFDDYTFGHPTSEAPFQASSITVDGVSRGEIKVYYDLPLSSKEKFLPEEQELLEQIAKDIGVIINRQDKIKQDELLQKQLIKEDRLHVLGELTAGIAHELNTPLGNILGYAEILKKTLTKKDNLSDIQRIITSALNAREIVKKLMYFSCEMPSNFSSINLNKIIHESLDLLKIQLQENKINLELKLAASLPACKGDQLQLTQVILNLIINAIDASPQGETIQLESRFDEHGVILQITDKGIGIKAESKDKIFQPFYTTKQTGTGLGLAVVHGIIQNHHGSISVESKEFYGTTFTIQLPY